jgi:hypothetical protein
MASNCYLKLSFHLIVCWPFGSFIAHLRLRVKISTGFGDVSVDALVSLSGRTEQPQPGEKSFALLSVCTYLVASLRFVNPSSWLCLCLNSFCQTCSEKKRLRPYPTTWSRVKRN